jgi:hypothetical protein
LSEQRWKKFIDVLKLDLGMEEWFHDSNDKREVQCARAEIAMVLWSLQQFFPRSDHTNGYKNIPKMHGMTKLQTYMTLFGSGINFYRSPETRHTRYLLKSLEEEYSIKLVGLHNKQHYNTTICWFLVMPLKNVIKLTISMLEK